MTDRDTLIQRRQTQDGRERERQRQRVKEKDRDRLRYTHRDTRERERAGERESERAREGWSERINEEQRRLATLLNTLCVCPHRHRLNFPTTACILELRCGQKSFYSTLGGFRRIRVASGLVEGGRGLFLSPLRNLSGENTGTTQVSRNVVS